MVVCMGRRPSILVSVNLCTVIQGEWITDQAQNAFLTIFTRRSSLSTSGCWTLGRATRIYVEQCGNPDGVPVLVLHGGPGGGCSPAMRRYFDPAVYRVVLFDQRGCGRSRPHSEVQGNTTWDLVADIELIRTTLGVDAFHRVWRLMGGNAGADLRHFPSRPRGPSGVARRLSDDHRQNWTGFMAAGPGRSFPIFGNGSSPPFRWPSATI